MSIFNSIPAPKNKRSRFNLSHQVTATMSIGALVPCLCEEVLPGDVWNLNTDFFCRYAPMLAPIMHTVDIKTETFFVPSRLVWENWQDFITGGSDGLSQPVKPFAYGEQINPFLSPNSLADYMDLPIPDSAEFSLPNDLTFRLDLMSFAAYQLIYQEYYRDQNLEEPAIQFPLKDGVQEESVIEELMRLRNRAWEKDYFTAALPWTQRGPQVTLPLVGDLTLEHNPDLGPTLTLTKQNDDIAFKQGSPLTVDPTLNTTQSTTWSTDENGNPIEATIDVTRNTTIRNTAQAVTINDLRKSSAIQRWLENNARGGSRYIEQILAHFGVISSDSRLQRPEWLGGGRTPSIISEVLQTSETQSTPQANMAGHGVAGGRSHGCLRKFEEHGFIITMVSAIPRSSYSQGLRMKHTRFDKFEYAWPELARLGEQPVFTRELYCRESVDMEKVFGYQPRYSEYKYIPSRVCGEFRQTLDYWNLTRKFQDEPVLSKDFVMTQPYEFNRIFAAGEESENQQIYLQIHHDIKCTRHLPTYGVPMLR